MTLKTRVDKLESRSTAGTVAGALGGMAVVEELPDGKFELPGGEVVTQNELDDRLRGCKGHLLILGGWHFEHMEQ
jgi:hypothetical protein